MKPVTRSVSWQSWAAIAVIAALLIAGVWVGFRWKALIRDRKSGPACGLHCGTERWAVKTLSDEGSTCIDFTPRETTVFWLVSQAPPERLPDQSRSGAIECQVWKVTAKLVGFKAEDDGDFHIVLADLERPELNMIVEIPDPACDGACASARELDIVRARESFTKAFGEPVKKFQRVSQTVIVRVIGVGFFDFKHRQTGLASNGIELHPLIGFEVNKGSQP
jgi:hypothetical protein